MNKISEFQILNTKEQKLNVCEGSYIEDPSCVVLHLHGIGAHFQIIIENEDCFLYKDFLFSSSNIKSYALEFSGHGKSDGLRCSIDNYDDLLEEISIMVKYIREKHIEKKIFIYGESMGAGLAVLYQMKYQLDSFIDGYILMAPMLGLSDSVKPSYPIIQTLIGLSWVFPELPLLGATTHISNSCKNKEYLSAKLKCKYQYNEKVRLNTARELYMAVEYIQENKDYFNSPCFILHGIDDTVTDPKKSISFYRSIKNKNKKLYLTHDCNHILTLGIDNNDKRPKEILNKIVSFITELNTSTT